MKGIIQTLTLLFLAIELNNLQARRYPWQRNQDPPLNLNVFMPLPNTLVSAECPWRVSVNRVENRIPSMNK